MNAMEQTEENLRVAAVTRVGDFTERDHAAVAEVRRIFRERLQVGCTACGYCLPCPHGVAIPTILSLYNEYHLTADPGAQQNTRFFYSGISGDNKPASACVQCSVCRDKCPQHIDIPGFMAKAMALFHAEANP